MYDIQPVMLVLTGAVLASAAVSDVRTREIGDAHWAVLVQVSFLGVAAGCTMLLPWASAVLLFLCAVSEGRKMRAAAGIAGSAAALAHLCTSGPVWDLVPAVMMPIVYLGYLGGMIKGGADAKALMALQVVLPVYPGDPGAVFPPVIGILFYAVILTVLGEGIWLIYRGIRDGCVSSLPRLRVGIDEAESSFVWPVERAVGGRVVRTGPQGWDEIPAVYAGLRGAGAETVLVEPMVPFLVPIAAGFLLAVLLGPPFGM